MTIATNKYDMASGQVWGFRIWSHVVSKNKANMSTDYWYVFTCLGGGQIAAQDPGFKSISGGFRMWSHVVSDAVQDTR